MATQEEACDMNERQDRHDQKIAEEKRTRMKRNEKKPVPQMRFTGVGCRAVGYHALVYCALLLSNWLERLQATLVPA